jgi:hypothetical protein
MRCDLAFFSHTAQLAKWKFVVRPTQIFRSELVIWLESNAHGCVCSIMSKVAFENFGQS